MTLIKTAGMADKGEIIKQGEDNIAITLSEPVLHKFAEIILSGRLGILLNRHDYCGA